MKVIIKDNDYFIKLQGTTDEPYFCGKDVCIILGYTDVKHSLQKHIKPKHKKILKDFLELDVELTSNSIMYGKESKEVGEETSPNSLDLQTQVVKLGESFKSIGYNDSKAIYVSEPGLYSLIMHSKTKFAEAFQDLVYETILPSIRKFGYYQLTTQLADKDKENAEKKTIHFKEMITRMNICLSFKICI